MTRRPYMLRVAISLDQLVNTVLAPLLNLTFRLERPPRFGDEDETMSSVLGKRREDCAGCRAVCRVLRYVFIWQWWRGIDHCEAAIEHDEGRHEKRA